MLCIAFLSIAVAGRIAMHYRFAGDHGIRIRKRHASTLLLFVQALLALSVVGAFVLSCLKAADLIRLQVDLGVTGQLVGIGIGLIGIATTVAAQFQMGASWRIGIGESESTELVTHGLYSYARNPIYTGMMLFGVGLLFLIPHPYMIPILAGGYLGIELHVRKFEEPHLHRQHGIAYATYFNGTGRYLPRLRRHPAFEEAD